MITVPLQGGKSLNVTFKSINTRYNLFQTQNSLKSSQAPITTVKPSTTTSPPKSSKDVQNSKNGKKMATHLIVTAGPNQVFSSHQQINSNSKGLNSMTSNTNQLQTQQPTDIAAIKQTTSNQNDEMIQNDAVSNAMDPLTENEVRRAIQAGVQRRNSQHANNSSSRRQSQVVQRRNSSKMGQHNDWQQNAQGAGGIQATDINLGSFQHWNIKAQQKASESQKKMVLQESGGTPQFKQHQHKDGSGMSPQTRLLMNDDGKTPQSGVNMVYTAQNDQQMSSALGNEPQTLHKNHILTSDSKSNIQTKNQQSEGKEIQPFVEDTGNFHDSVYSGEANQDRAKQGPFENTKISQNGQPLVDDLTIVDQSNTKKTQPMLESQVPTSGQNDSEIQKRSPMAISRRVGSKLSGVPLDMNETPNRAENSHVQNTRIEEVNEEQNQRNGTHNNGLEGGNSSIEIPSAATENEAGGFMQARMPRSPQQIDEFLELNSQKTDKKSINFKESRIQKYKSSLEAVSTNMNKEGKQKGDNVLKSATSYPNREEMMASSPEDELGHEDQSQERVDKERIPDDQQNDENKKIRLESQNIGDTSQVEKVTDQQKNQQLENEVQNGDSALFFSKKQPDDSQITAPAEGVSPRLRKQGPRVVIQSQNNNQNQIQSVAPNDSINVTNQSKMITSGGGVHPDSSQNTGPTRGEVSLLKAFSSSYGRQENPSERERTVTNMSKNETQFEEEDNILRDRPMLVDLVENEDAQLTSSLKQGSSIQSRKKGKNGQSGQNSPLLKSSPQRLKHHMQHSETNNEMTGTLKIGSDDADQIFSSNQKQREYVREPVSSFKPLGSEDIKGDNQKNIVTIRQVRNSNIPQQFNTVDYGSSAKTGHQNTRKNMSFQSGQDLGKFGKNPLHLQPTSFALRPSQNANITTKSPNQFISANDSVRLSGFLEGQELTNTEPSLGPIIDYFSYATNQDSVLSPDGTTSARQGGVEQSDYFEGQSKILASEIQNLSLAFPNPLKSPGQHYQRANQNQQVSLNKPKYVKYIPKKFRSRTTVREHIKESEGNQGHLNKNQQQVQIEENEFNRSNSPAVNYVTAQSPNAMKALKSTPGNYYKNRGTIFNAPQMYQKMKQAYESGLKTSPQSRIDSPKVYRSLNIQNDLLDQVPFGEKRENHDVTAHERSKKREVETQTLSDNHTTVTAPVSVPEYEASVNNNNGSSQQGNRILARKLVAWPTFEDGSGIGNLPTNLVGSTCHSTTYSSQGKRFQKNNYFSPRMSSTQGRNIINDHQLGDTTNFSQVNNGEEERNGNGTLFAESQPKGTQWRQMLKQTVKSAEGTMRAKLRNINARSPFMAEHYQSTGNNPNEEEGFVKTQGADLRKGAQNLGGTMVRKGDQLGTNTMNVARNHMQTQQGDRNRQNGMKMLIGGGVGVNQEFLQFGQNSQDDHHLDQNLLSDGPPTRQAKLDLAIRMSQESQPAPETSKTVTNQTLIIEHQSQVSQKNMKIDSGFETLEDQQKQTMKIPSKQNFKRDGKMEEKARFGSLPKHSKTQAKPKLFSSIQPISHTRANHLPNSRVDHSLNLQQLAIRRRTDGHTNRLHTKNQELNIAPQRNSLQIGVDMSLKKELSSIQGSIMENQLYSHKHDNRQGSIRSPRRKDEQRQGRMDFKFDTQSYTGDLLGSGKKFCCQIPSEIEKAPTNFNSTTVRAGLSSKDPPRRATFDCLKSAQQRKRVSKSQVPHIKKPGALQHFIRPIETKQEQYRVALFDRMAQILTENTNSVLDPPVPQGQFLVDQTEQDYFKRKFQREQMRPGTQAEQLRRQFNQMEKNRVSMTKTQIFGRGSNAAIPNQMTQVLNSNQVEDANQAIAMIKFRQDNLVTFKNGVKLHTSQFSQKPQLDLQILMPNN